MRNIELIARLQEYPPDAEVQIDLGSFTIEPSLNTDTDKYTDPLSGVSDLINRRGQHYVLLEL